MAMVINTNNSSNNAVRLLDKTQRSQDVTMERLTSGLRINSSKDDAAGLSVVTNMTTQIRGLDMAIRNANDGLSMVQTMDAAMEEVTNMLQRMRELGIQAQNGTYTSAQRADMNVEYSQLTAEMNRVASATKFNGIALFDTGAPATPAVPSTSTTPAIPATSARLGMNGMSFHVGWENGVVNRIGSGELILDQSLQGMAASLNTVSANLLTRSNASLAVEKLNNALSQVQTSRARWGAIMNRLDYTLNNLQSVKTNTEASRSRILDTDYAKEAANLARTQVLQQAGMSMLSQSNQNSQNVMSLLQN